MLILERRPGTSIRIGDDVRIEVRQIRNRRAVRLAIDAPKEMPIVREEIADRYDQPTESNATDRHFRVMLIEDNPAHAKLTQHALSENGVSDVVLHRSGADAIAALTGLAKSDHRPDLILLDYRLPDMSGLDILKDLRARDEFRKTAIVMLSAIKNDQQVAKCLDVGANAFVVKDTQYEQLKQSIGRITAFWLHARLVA